MQIPVLIEPVAGNGYRAAALGYSAEGSTRDEALGKVQEMLKERVASGAEIVSLSLPKQPPPWAEFAGDLRDDPMLEDWKKAMAEYRRKRDKQLEKLLKGKSRRRVK